MLRNVSRAARLLTATGLSVAGDVGPGVEPVGVATTPGRRLGRRWARLGHRIVEKVRVAVGAGGDIPELDPVPGRVAHDTWRCRHGSRRRIARRVDLDEAIVLVAACISDRKVAGRVCAALLQVCARVAIDVRAQQVDLDALDGVRAVADAATVRMSRKGERRRGGRGRWRWRDRRRRV